MLKETAASRAEFDRIADMYDETRRPLDEGTLAGIRAMLAEHGCRSVLEIGVGTGRIALPLLKSGYDVIGLDISLRMMEKARVKGIKDLVLAQGSGVPFRDSTFDAVIMAHVFHLLDDPFPVMREAARVSRVGVFALVSNWSGNRPWPPFFGRDASPSVKGGGSGEGTIKAMKFFEEMRGRLRSIAEKYGYDWKSGWRSSRWEREQRILESQPPDELKVVSEVTVTENINEWIDRLEKGAYSSMSGMPDAMRQEMAREMRAIVPSIPPGVLQPRKEVYQVALWLSSSLLGRK